MPLAKSNPVFLIGGIPGVGLRNQTTAGQRMPWNVLVSFSENQPAKQSVNLKEKQPNKQRNNMKKHETTMFYHALPLVSFV